MAEKKKILIIDDEPDFCFLVKTNLEDTEEFEVVTSNNPEMAEDVIRNENPDLIILDNVMPKRQGSELVKDLKKNPDIHGIPIIMVSGRGEMVYIKGKDQFKWLPNSPVLKDRKDIVEGKNPETLSKAYGVDDYVAKPFSTEILIQVIHEVLEKIEKKKGREDGGQNQNPYD